MNYEISVIISGNKRVATKSIWHIPSVNSDVMDNMKTTHNWIIQLSDNGVRLNGHSFTPPMAMPTIITLLGDYSRKCELEKGRHVFTWDNHGIYCYEEPSHNFEEIMIVLTIVSNEFFHFEPSSVFEGSVEIGNHIITKTTTSMQLKEMGFYRFSPSYLGIAMGPHIFVAECIVSAQSDYRDYCSNKVSGVHLSKIGGWAKSEWTLKHLVREYHELFPTE